MSILFCVSIAWFTVCVLFVGLGLIFLLILEHASDVSQATGADGGTIQKARELADTFDALAQLEDMITLAPRDAIPTAHHAVPDRTQHTGAVIIRDPRLTRARSLSDQSVVGLNATFVFPTVCGGRDTAA